MRKKSILFLSNKNQIIPSLPYLNNKTVIIAMEYEVRLELEKQDIIFKTPYEYLQEHSFKNLDITAIPTTVSQSQLAIDATVGSTLGTYRVPLSSIRDFVLNSSSTAYNVTGLTTDTSHIAMGVPTGTNIGIGTTAPEQKLHVVGGIYSTQSITALSGFVGNADTSTALQNSCTIKTIGAITSPTAL